MTSGQSAPVPPRLFVDGRVVTHPTAAGRGVARYTVGIVRAAAHAGAEVMVLCGTGDDHDEWSRVAPEITRRPLLPSAVADAPRDRTWFVCTQLMLHPPCLDVIPRFITHMRMPVVGVLHDVIPQRFPERYLTDPAARIQTRLRESLCRTIDVFWTNSEFTANTGAVELGVARSRLHHVGAVIDPIFCPGDPGPLPVGVRPGAVVAVTGADDRKNTERLIRAWSRVPDTARGDRQLVIVCAVDADTRSRWHHTAHHAGVADSVVITGAIDDTELVSLYRSATIGVMPSLEEGFGLPVAESIACGTPCLCSNVSSLPEVAGTSEGLFDPYDVMSMAGAISAYLTDASLRTRLLSEQEAGGARWHPSRVGAQMLAALPDATPANRVESDMATHRPSVVFAGPHPCADSGIVAYSDMVLAEWPGDAPQRMDDVQLSPAETSGGRFAGDDASGARGLIGHLGRHAHVHDHDHVVMVLGSSEHHAFGADRARDGRCHVWLHEPTLVGAVVGSYHYGGGRVWMESHLRDWFGADAATDAVRAAQEGDAQALHAQGHDACSAVVAAARSVIVSSDDAAQVIRQYTSAPILVLPLGHPQRASTSPQFGHVVALGRVDDGKHPEVLVDLAAADPRLIITAIGRLSDEDRQRCMERAHALGCAQRIRFTGAISDAERDAVLATAWVGVQLRSGHPGQMSASITELLARAIPVVTTMTTHGADAAGLRVISAPDAVAVINAMDPWWSAQDWAVASQWAADTAASHTANEVARRLATWLDEVDRLPSGVYR